MLHPETQLDLVRARHSDLLRSARAGELATRLADSRREERRTFLARLRLRRDPCQSSTSPAST
jgi:antitoxin (DNA-binding transcriptional repressor) of toxin-antitoxin stability system